MRATPPTSPYGQDLQKARYSYRHGDIPKQSFHYGRDAERHAMNGTDFTAAAMGKFSECLFQKKQAHKVTRPLSSKSDFSLHVEKNPRFESSSSLPGLSSPSSSHLAKSAHSAGARPIKSLRSDRDESKRLVNQFLNLEEEFPDKHDVEALNASQRSSISLNSQHESLSQQMFYDLKDTTALREPSLLCPQSTNGSPPTLATELSKFDCTIRHTLANLQAKESAMGQTMADLDCLYRDVLKTQEAMREIYSHVAEHELQTVRSSFDSENANSFIGKFTKTVSSCSEDLEVFERHIGKCKVELTDHKATVHKLETTIKLNEMLRDSQSSMRLLDRLREYKGIIVDFLALVLLLASVFTLRHVFT
ncbi:LADA_0F07448g1_1 [Lachancea dasiensis]|uniref:LADA_0F07448g1_1 n=1 Tax=Lachancea dasiensis TaxID=1072105 RepID=A0A1G4JKI5_9SACH|nr:LADA_0F07448g1_1 [Lachancea dasiensis]